MAQIDIKGLNKAQVFKALYDNAQVQGMGFLQFVPGDISIEEAEKIVKTQTSFDYYKGRVMKIDISGDTLQTYVYDRDNGEGTAAAAIKAIKPAE